MNFDNFKSIFTVLYNETAKQNAFIDSLPRSINMAFCDNEYTESMATEKRVLLKHLFSKPIVDDIDYFIYEFKLGYKVVVNNVEYSPKNLEEILNYFKEIHYANN